MKEIAKEELSRAGKRKMDLIHHIEDELTPPDPMADRDIIVEIRAGVGGDEAELFAASLFRMYALCREKRLENNSDRLAQYAFGRIQRSHF